MTFLLLVFSLAFGMAFVHQGSFDASAATDVLLTMGAQFSNTALSGATLPAGAITGAGEVFLLSTGANGTTLTTRTAALLFADLQLATGLQNVIGYSYFLRITNTSAGTTTIGAGTGVTITGPATIATNTFRDYIVTVNGPTAITLQSVGVGTAP
jgi:hypothetical protein